ncbi:TonB family protein [Fulvivirga ligni]|uniref:TonB family protein n=1 Tax=Fulvivirga ligni TaxID=2904246 RepID=UPI001F2909CD|nr:TonB family protein [Fulvivirga ligni]UII19871.1 TonB family protein [Fulvivirga ligni]
MRYFLITLFIAVLLPFYASAKILTGKLIDEKSGEVIRGAAVIKYGTSSGDYTNYLGFFELSVAEGDSLIIAHPSYVTSGFKVSQSEQILIRLRRNYVKMILTNDDLDVKIGQGGDDEGAGILYRGGQSQFYSDLKSAFKSAGLYKDDEQYEAEISFTIDANGSLGEVEARVEGDSANHIQNIMGTALEELKGFMIATSNDLPIRQYYRLNLKKREEVFAIVDDPAMPIGGYPQFYQYVAINLRYPVEARRLGIQGKVYASMVVGKDGQIKDVEVVKGIGGGCDEETLRVIRNSPKWTPAFMEGEAVEQRIVLPVTFKLGRETTVTFTQYVSEKIVYPSEARSGGIEGIVHVSFMVKNNKISDLHIINDIGGGCADEVKKALASVPSELLKKQFFPSRIYIQPIIFRLSRDPRKFEEIELPEGVVLQTIIITAIMMKPNVTDVFEMMHDNRYSSIGEAIMKNPKITHLSLTKTNLKNVDRNIYKLKKLITLDLEKNNIADLPDEICMLSNLEKLFLPYNELSSLPANFDQLENLKILGLGENKFEKFPEVILQMENLRALDLSDNAIGSIPADIYKLKKLEILALNFTGLTSLPKELYEMKQLKELSLVGNAINDEELKLLSKALKKTIIIFE